MTHTQPDCTAGLEAVLVGAATADAVFTKLAVVREMPDEADKSHVPNAAWQPAPQYAAPSPVRRVSLL